MPCIPNCMYTYSILCHIIIHNMSHHHTYYVTSSYILCHIIRYEQEWTHAYILCHIIIHTISHHHRYEQEWTHAYIHAYIDVCVCVCVCVRACVFCTHAHTHIVWPFCSCAFPACRSYSTRCALFSLSIICSCHNSVLLVLSLHAEVTQLGVQKTLIFLSIICSCP